MLGMKTPCLYRHFCQNGTLLYVGQTMNVMNRTRSHEQASSWFKQVARIDVEPFPTRAEATIAERTAIMTENPKYNLAFPKESSRQAIEARRAKRVPVKASGTPTLLDRVRAKMMPLQGNALLEVGEATGISYDTLRRIKLQLCDPAFSKVQRLAEHFRVVRK
jgi:predicted GIY-YIG superfamily endonuclease